MSTVLGISLMLLGVFGASLSQQISEEFKAWAPWIAQRIFQRSIQALPPELQIRYNEEWLSDLEQVPGYVGKVIFAVGLLTAARRLELEHQRQQQYEASLREARQKFKRLTYPGQPEQAQSKLHSVTFVSDRAVSVLETLLTLTMEEKQRRDAMDLERQKRAAMALAAAVVSRR